MSKYNHYNWEGVRYGKRRNTPTTDPLTKWIMIALLLAIICHVVVLVALKKMPVFFQSNNSNEILTQSVVVRNVEEQRYVETPRENLLDELESPVETADVLIEELEMLEESPEDIEIDFSPAVDGPEISVPIETPAISGDFESSALDFTSGMDISEVIEDLGSTNDFLKPAIGQITVDPGKQTADEFDPDLFNIELAKGADGDVKDGVLEGFTPLSEMTRLSQSDLALAKGMIGSDLLFEFNKYTLRESAKNSLLKVVLLIDKNPNMKCWIEGHTDLIGSDEANVKLSIARAEAVRNWLVHSMKISESRLFVRGLGESSPIVVQGDKNEQAINRRVEIKMRNDLPPELNKIFPEKETRKPRLIKPLRNPNLAESSTDKSLERMSDSSSNTPNIDKEQSPALRPLPLVDSISPNIQPKKSAPAPKAVPIKEPNSEPVKTPSRAIPVEDTPVIPLQLPPAKAVPVEEPTSSRAVPVEDESSSELPNSPTIPPKAIPVE